MQMFGNSEGFPLKIVRCLEGWKSFMTELSPEITDRNPREKPAQMLHGTGILTYIYS